VTGGDPQASLAPAAPATGSALDARAPQFRYFGVLALMLLAVVFLIAAPASDWAKSVAIAIEGGALVVTIATSRQKQLVRRRRAAIVSLGMLALVLAIGFGLVGRVALSGVALVVTVAIPVALSRGLLRLLRTEGVTIQSVAGAVGIYLSVGLVFAWVIGFVAGASGTPYFAGHTSTSTGVTVYYSFTVLTTTGFGDYVAATPTGHAIAVIEMLTGQIYLVTVIGLLIGNFAARPARA
jgi:hypothetical protein